MISLYYNFKLATNATDSWKYYIRVLPPKTTNTIPALSDRLYLQNGHLRLWVEPSKVGADFPIWDTYNNHPTLRLDNAYKVDLYRWKEAINLPGKRTSRKADDELITTYYWVVLPIFPQVSSITLPVVEGVVDLKAHPTVFDIDKVTADQVDIQYTFVDNAMATPNKSYRHRILVNEEISEVSIEYNQPTLPIQLCLPY